MMGVAIYTGKCRGGPLNGQTHRQTTKPPTIAGCFNYESLATHQCGSYTYEHVNGGEWIWSDDPIKKEDAPIGAG